MCYPYSFRILLSDSSEDERERLARVARTEELGERGCGDFVRGAVYTVTTFGDSRQVLWDLERGSDGSEDKLTDFCFKTLFLYDLESDILFDIVGSHPLRERFNCDRR